MAFNWKQFNLNNAVKVKLSEAGHQEMERQHYDLYEKIGRAAPRFERKKCDENGWTSFQMHTLMNTFGHMLVMGNPPSKIPFDSLDIRICDLLLEDIEPD